MAKKKPPVTDPHPPDTLEENAQWRRQHRPKEPVGPPAEVNAQDWRAAMIKRFKESDPDLYTYTVQFFEEIKEQNRRLWLQHYELKETVERWKKLCHEYGEGHDKARAEVAYFRSLASDWEPIAPAEGGAA